MLVYNHLQKYCRMIPTIGWSLGFYNLATSKVISGWIPTCAVPLYNAAPLGDEAVSTMTWCPIQSHFPGNGPTSSHPILIMPSVWLGSDKYQFVSHWILRKNRGRWVAVWVSPVDRAMESGTLGGEMASTNPESTKCGFDSGSRRSSSPFHHPEYNNLTDK